MPDVVIPYGTKTIGVRIPAANFGELLAPRYVPCGADVASAVEAVLCQPVDSRPLKELAEGKRRVAVVVDDYTRPTPVAEMLPAVLEHLVAAGVRQRDILIVVALGTHRAMTKEELRAKLGDAIAADYAVVNKAVGSGAQYRYLGRSRLGVKVRMLSEVTDADLRVGIGSIVPHCDVGYSGGGKILLPGVCAAETVAMNHIKGLEFKGINYLGADTTLIRDDLEDVVARMVGPLFVVNCVTTGQGEVAGVVGGHPIDAQRAGLSLARQVYAVPADERADITIVSSYPGDVDFVQVSKAIWSGDKLTQPGGDLIVITPCYEGVGRYEGLLELMTQNEGELTERITSGEIGPTLEGVMAALAVRVKRIGQRIRITMVSESSFVGHLQTMGFPVFSSAEAALAAALSRQGAAARVSVITHGGQIYPVVS